MFKTMRRVLSKIGTIEKAILIVAAVYLSFAALIVSCGKIQNSDKKYYSRSDLIQECRNDGNKLYQCESMVHPDAGGWYE